MDLESRLPSQLPTTETVETQSDSIPHQVRTDSNISSNLHVAVENLQLNTNVETVRALQVAVDALVTRIDSPIESPIHDIECTLLTDAQLILDAFCAKRPNIPEASQLLQQIKNILLFRCSDTLHVVYYHHNGTSNAASLTPPTRSNAEFSPPYSSHDTSQNRRVAYFAVPSAAAAAFACTGDDD